MTQRRTVSQPDRFPPLLRLRSAIFRLGENEIAADAGGAVLLTWATDFAANDGISWPLGNAYSLMRQFDPDSDQPAQMFVGLYSVDGSGQTFVGGIRIPEPVAEIAVGAPVLATRIR